MENVSINFTIELPELTQDWGNGLLEGTNRTLCAPEPRQKSIDPIRNDPDFPVSVQESPAEAWVNSALLQDWGH